MPSREDIIKQLSIISQYCERPDVEMAIDEVVAEVEAMRCETCKHRIAPGELMGPIRTCNLFWISNVGKDFGCFSHEPKEDK
jgi:hypothetical protein